MSRYRLSRLKALGAGVLVMVTMAGCSMDEVQRGWLPTERGMTDHTDIIMNLWNGSWIAAWIVGALTWGLMFWCMIAYRRRKNDTSLPVQLRYHLPLEIMYTIIPVMMVGVLFFFTARDMAIINNVDLERTDTEEIQVIGKRWAWDFNYTSAGVWATSEQVPLDGTDAPEAMVPTLYLPVDKPVTLKVDSRDVIHSFWVPAFLYKKDMIPGKTDNYYQFTPHIEGVYPGKCAELCGEYHSEMIFQVAVVSQEEFDLKMQELRAEGQTGELALDLGRSDGPEHATSAEGE
ncbi:MAG: cytochrome c oxidase subunit II [Actinomycetales bacterium]